MYDMSSDDREPFFVKQQDGDTATELVDLLNRYERSLCNYLTAILGDHDASIECTQDTFVRAYENWKRGKPVTVAWLYKVARNRALDEVRHRQRSHAAPDVLDRIPSEHHTVSSETLAVRQVMDALVPSEREVLYLFVFDRFKTAEIAQMLGIGAGATRMRLLRARQHFRDLWEELS